MSSSSMTRLASFSRLASISASRLAVRPRFTSPAVISRCQTVSNRQFSTTFARFATALDSSTPLSFQDFESYREKKEATIIDVRQPEELLTDGQIPMSTNIPITELEKAFRMSAADFEQTYRVAKPQAADPVIFFCKGGVRASEANDFARWLFQYSNTAFFSGIIEWKAKTGGSASA